MILLTGAAGFIGSNVLQALNDQGRDDIICVDDLTNGAKCRNLVGKKFWRYVDRRAVFGLDRALFSEIIHLGANVDTTCTDGRAMVRDNYDVSFELYKHFVLDNPECTFVYASTAGVYGLNDKTAAAGFRETPECEDPHSPYAFSKWLFDSYMRIELGALHTMSITGLRFFNVYGPGEQHKKRMRSAIGNMINDINEGRRPVLFDGSEWIMRDFVWVGDAVNTVLWALDSRPRGIFNVGSGVARSFLDAYNAVADAAAYDGHPQYVDFPKDLRHYQCFTQADLTNLRAAGFTHKFATLEEGVKQYVAQYHRS
jgi:ADP-L-glycero-D-manno-heptose 6-epimerase